MSNLIVEDRDGNKNTIIAEEGLTLMEIIRDAGLDIEAACGGCCACATCHIYVNKEWLDKLSKIEEEEESMLDQAFNVKKESRLACQIEFISDFDGMTVKLAPE